MSDYQPQSPRRRPARRRKTWRNYVPTIVMVVLTLVCMVTVVVAVGAVLNAQKDKLDAQPDPTGKPQLNSPEDTTAPSDSTDSTDSTDAPGESAIDELIAEADFIAAGYDYEKAIALLQASPYYSESTELADKVAEYQQLDTQLVTYASPETITHIFFHSLIADPARAFDGDVDSNGYNMYMTTVDEFIAILEEMYDRGYVLISPYDIAYEVTDSDGTHFTYGDIRLPAGKTPFLMSQDDLNYYSYMVGTGSGINETPVFVDANNDGFAHKIVIGEDGYPTCEYMDADGNITTGDYDLVPVLETFIQSHPDFSYHGARAILGVTGYEGVFGYRTKPSYEAAMGSEAYAAEVQAAKEVAQCLRDHGWVLASHSYGHPAYGELSAERVATDSDKWLATVGSIIGDVDVILYPYGSDINSFHKYTFENEKFAALYEDGFRYFFNVDGNQYWNQLGDNYFRGGRRNVDGYRMYHNPDMLADLFDVSKVFDSARPTPVPDNGSGM